MSSAQALHTGQILWVSRYIKGPYLHQVLLAIDLKQQLLWVLLPVANEADAPLLEEHGVKCGPVARITAASSRRMQKSKTYMCQF
jgi:hypothetical protein